MKLFPADVPSDNRHFLCMDLSPWGNQMAWRNYGTLGAPGAVLFPLILDRTLLDFAQGSRGDGDRTSPLVGTSVSCQWGPGEILRGATVAVGVRVVSPGGEGGIFLVWTRAS